MSKKINKKAKGIIIILVLILVIVIVLIIGNNLRQTSQKKKELQKSVETVEKIDINKAGIETLSKLPGIGPVKSKIIFDYREKNGEFKSLIDLTKVKGIGKKTLAKLLPHLEMIGDSAKVKSYLSGVLITENSQIIGKINLNTATIFELTSLKGIGEKKAELIIKYRKENGNFKTIGEIQNVKGIGEKIFQQNKDKITIKNEKK